MLNLQKEYIPYGTSHFEHSHSENFPFQTKKFKILSIKIKNKFLFERIKFEMRIDQDRILEMWMLEMIFPLQNIGSHILK